MEYPLLIVNSGYTMNPKNQKQERKTVDVSVELDPQGRGTLEYGLNVTLTNRSMEPLTVYHHSLPWVGWNSILLVAVKTDAPGIVIDKSQLIDDPGPERIIIKPAETLVGHISLVSRFPDLLKALIDREVIVFWSYRFQPIDAPPLQRVSGHVLLSKLPDGG